MKPGQVQTAFWRGYTSLLKKELTLLLVSPLPWLATFAFLLATLFSFFWLEGFFARNMVDVKPLFDTMPPLLAVLCSAFSMRTWSDEKRLGSLSAMMAYGVHPLVLVLAKYSALLLFVSVVVLLTLPMPFSVSGFAPLDSGAVFSGYLASLLLAMVYLAVGVFCSSLSSNAVVSFLLALLFNILLYYLADNDILALFDYSVQETFRQFSAFYHFETFTKGVLAITSLLYFLSCALLFLSLNVFVLVKNGWSRPGNASLHRGACLLLALLFANVICLNVLTNGNQLPRYDLTAEGRYSLSPVTHRYLQQLDSPLLIRAYLSERSHPMLMPLRDEMAALLAEYAYAGNRFVSVEVMDPRNDPYVEMEAVSKYGIASEAFQVNDRFQSGFVNAYFHIVVQYGDQYEVLDAKSLIEMKLANETDMQVVLRNPEYDITSAIEKVISRYRQSADFLSGLEQPLMFTGYFSADLQLPEDYRVYKQAITDVLAELQGIGGARFQARFADPAAREDLPERLTSGFGFTPIEDEQSGQRFWFSMTLRSGNKAIPLALPKPFNRQSFRMAVERAARQFAPASQKTLLLVYPPFNHNHHEFTYLEEQLGQVMRVKVSNLLDSSYDPTAEIMLLVAPEALDASQVEKIDAFFRQGKTVIVATSPFVLQGAKSQLKLLSINSGLEDWLAQQGVRFDEQVVLDQQHARFAAPVTRKSGTYTFQDYQMLDYPYFPEIRGSGLASLQGLDAGIDRIVMAWASPLLLDASVQEQANILLQSTSQSWLSRTRIVTPTIDDRGNSIFTARGPREAYPLAVELTVPVNTAENEVNSRLLVFASNEFLRDQTLQLLGTARGTVERGSVLLLQNLLTAMVSDRGLLDLRLQSRLSHALPAMDRHQQQHWEWRVYGLTLGGFLAAGLLVLVWRFMRKRRLRAIVEAAR